MTEEQFRLIISKLEAIERAVLRPQKSHAAMLVIKGRELERVMEKIRNIKAQYGDHQTWAQDDRKRVKMLNERLVELRAELGVKE